MNYRGQDVAHTISRLAVLMAAVLGGPATASDDFQTDLQPGVCASASTDSTTSVTTVAPLCVPHELRAAREELRLAQEALGLLDENEVVTERYLNQLGAILDWAEQVDLSRLAGVLAQNLAEARSALLDETSNYLVWSRLSRGAAGDEPVPVPERFIRPVEVEPMEVFDFSARRAVRDLMA